jgi:hypothetical protein
MNASPDTDTRPYLRGSQASIAIVLIGGVANASTNLLTNGSFETPIVEAGKFTRFSGGSSSITGWTVVGPEASIVNSTFTSWLIQFPASDGSQWLDLTGFFSRAVEGVEQTVPTVAGNAYRLSFEVGNVFDPRGIYGTTSTVAVMVNDMLLGTFTNSCTTCRNALAWKTSPPHLWQLVRLRSSSF